MQAGHTIRVVPSGAVAGVMARTDSAKGVWRSAAGQALVGVSSLSRMLSDSERAVLNARAINALRSVPWQEPIIWGMRTLAGSETYAGDFRYVPVRRLALFVWQSVARSPAPQGNANDETLWAEIRDVVSDFLHGLFLDGPLQERDPTRRMSCGATARP